MALAEYSSEKIWSILVEAVHDLVMFNQHKAYTRDSILQETPNVKPEELAARLGITLGEALVILSELKKEREAQL
jgi:hypothetical protein